MKLKTLALLAASAIGVNANALDLNGYAEYENTNIGTPLVFKDGYYANSQGEVYKDLGSKLDLLYDLPDGSLIDLDGDIAIGYVSVADHQGGHFYFCSVENCMDESSRTYIESHDYMVFDSLPSQNLSSGFGEYVIKSRLEGTTDYTVSVVNSDGEILDGFIVKPRSNTYYITSHVLTATTGITKERNFKLLTASHGEYLAKMKLWNSVNKNFEDLAIQTSNGSDINSVYQNGIAPIAIDGPNVDSFGNNSYRVVLASLSSKTDDNPTINSIVWGDVKVENGNAEFLEEVNEISMPSTYLTSSLPSARPYFHTNDTFTFLAKTLDFTSNTIENTVNERTDREFNAWIYMVSPKGKVVVYDAVDPKGTRLFSPVQLSLRASSKNIDPYLNPALSLALSSDLIEEYYGVEATCSLQTTNVTVDSNNYIDLSETALQIPIEWDSVTGEWKGAQSLTGLESLSGSKDFAQFNLTADVTTGTWTMNCSGIASDIEGNKIELNPAEITINLDDQIHGGTSVISGQIQIPNTTDYSGVVVTITLNGRQIEVTTMEDGSFEFDRLVEGDYTVHVYSEQYVAACNNLTLDGTNAAAPLTIEMYAGDINNDGAVDIGDFSYLASLYGLSSADEQYDALADLNHDGTINVQDLSILGSHFGTDHCEVVPE